MNETKQSSRSRPIGSEKKFNPVVKFRSSLSGQWRWLPLVVISAIAVCPSPAAAITAPWSGILDPSRATDWSKSGLPAVLPNGETTPNPWTPPSRTACTTSQCNVVSGGNVTAATLSAALASAPNGTYVQIPAGTFNLGGNLTLTKSYVTLRGSGAQATKLTGGTIRFDGATGGWANAGLLSGAIAKDATSVNLANGQAVPTGGRMAALSQCMTGFSAPNAFFTHYSGGDWVSKCAGTIADPGGPWVCGGFSQCNRNGNRNVTNPHFQGQVVWLDNVSGNTASVSSPIRSPLWSTSRSASLMWMSGPGMVGAGLENLTSESWINMNGCYACWIKGVRIIFTDSAPTLTTFTSHALFANNYFAGNSPGFHTIGLGYENDTTLYESDTLMLNNLFIACYIEQNGGNSGYVQAYNYFANVPSGYAGDFPHNPGGQVYMLREGNQLAISWDDDTWTTHNFSTWFRNWASGVDFVNGAVLPNPIDVGGFSRFNNVIGNVIGSPQSTGNYGQVLGVNRIGLDTTGLTEASLMRWGNYVHCSGDAAHCQVAGGAFDLAEVPTDLSRFGANSTPYQNPVPANRNLPPSFFMNGMVARPNGGTGLSWWKTCTRWTTFPTSCASYSTPPMPPIGPDVTGGPRMNGHVWDIPAALAWTNLPADPAYGNGIRQFDERVYQMDSGGSPPPVNQAPAANAGADQTITLPSLATLSGTATDDGLPNPPAALTYSWSKASGPGTVTFANASARQTTATFSQGGTYVLRLTASDSALSGTDDVQVTVNGGTLVNAASCSRVDVQAAINAASPGDTVVVPAGTCSWSGNVSISGITLVGAGKGTSGTVITAGSAALTKHATQLTRLSGFRFTGSDTHASVAGSDSARAFIIDNSFFNYGSAPVLAISVNGGLLHHNDFVAPSPTSSDFFGIKGNLGGWTQPPTMGTADTTGERNIYFEDNTFSNILETAPDGDEAVRLVFRHNTWTDSSLVFHAGGPANDTSIEGHRHFEIYNNTFARVSNSAALNKWIWVRGGTGVIANNVFARADSPDGSSYPNKSEIQLGIGCETGSYPIPFQIGQVANPPEPVPSRPLLIFGNTGPGASDSNFVAVRSNDTGGSGHTCGNPGSFVQSGRDYVLSNSWGWTPYVYPHPLQNSTTPPPPPSDTTPPSVPTGLGFSQVQGTSVRLDWNASTDNIAVGGYRLDVSQTSNFASFISGYANRDVGNVTGVTISGLTPGTAYYARLRAYDTSGNTSANSATAGVTTSLTPGLPPLATPTLNLPSVMSLTDEITAGYSGDLSGVGFEWTFESAQGSALGAGAPALRSPGTQAFGAPVIVTSPKASLSIFSLSPGPYTVTVTAVRGSERSSPASARVTLVSAELSAVRVYPNPWRADRHAGDIVFDNLPVNSTVKIFTAAGHKVWQRSGSGQVQWNRKTDSGDSAASGIYLYLIEAGGSTRKGKLAVVR